jgi:hypothetical protein
MRSFQEPRVHSFPYLTLDKDVRQLHPSDVAAFAAQISGGTLNPLMLPTTTLAKSGTPRSIADRR